MPDAKHLTYLPSVKRGSGWRPEFADDENDYKLSDKLGALPNAPSDRPRLKDPQFFPKIRDQGNLGSCTGHMVRNAMAYKIRQRLGDRLQTEWGKKWDLSPLAAYWLARDRDGSTSADVGAYIRDAAIACREFGIPTEESWPYDITKFKRKPNAKALETGRWHQADQLTCYRCDEDGDRSKIIDRMLQALQADLPLGFGFTCYDNLGQADSNGVVPLPVKGSRIEGGHAVNAADADIASRIFWGWNHWGGKWGANPADLGISGLVHNERGWIGVPFDYFIRGLADDVWAFDLEHIG